MLQIPRFSGLQFLATRTIVVEVLDEKQIGSLTWETPVKESPGERPPDRTVHPHTRTSPKVLLGFLFWVCKT